MQAHVTLTPWEYDRIRRLLAREPRELEGAIIAALWDERCSYKSSKAYLSKLPTGNSKLASFALISYDQAQVLACSVKTSLLQSEEYEQTQARLMREHSVIGAQTLLTLECSSIINNCNNFLSLGLASPENIIPASARDIKSRVLYAGAELDKANNNISNKLRSACKNIIDKKLIQAIMSVDIAGLAQIFFTMTSGASTGMIINLDDISNLDFRRDPQAILLSEKPERVILIAEPNKISDIKEIFYDHALFCDDIGRVSSDGLVRVNFQGQEIINLPALLISENAPRYRHSYQSIVPKAAHKDFTQSPRALGDIIAQSNYNFKEPIIINNTSKNIIISWLCYDQILKTHPFEGAKRAIWQATLELSVMGAKPTGFFVSYVSSSLEEEKSMTQFKHAMDGLAYAAQTLAPVLAAHVDINNHANTASLALGALGFTQYARPEVKFVEHEYAVLILGELPLDYTGAEKIVSDAHNNYNLRAWDFEHLDALCEITRTCALMSYTSVGLVVGAGGLLAACKYLMKKYNIGVRLDFGAEWLPHDLVVGLISEDTPRVLVCVAQSNLSFLMNACAQKIPIHRIGTVGAKNLIIYHQDYLVYQELS